MAHPARAWHEETPAGVLAALATSPEGLTLEEARRRLEAVGPNLLREAPRTPWWRLFLGQFHDFMVLVLVAAAGASYALGERADAATILAIVFLNACLGFIQEYRAEASLAALKRLSAPVARVRRAGRQETVPARDLVPGDILLLEAGDRVPADARLLTAHALAADEAALTGESVPVTKDAAWVAPPATPLADRKNMVFMGTVITRGRAEAVVVATGMATEVGRIAGLIQEAEEGPTPLQRRLEQLGRWLVLVCLAVCALVVAAGLARPDPAVPPAQRLTRMFLTGVSLAVAAIPEGLPAVVTVCLAIGVQRMIRRNAIVRKLQAVETLGCATAILSDKTGTLTRNEMTVRQIYAAGRTYSVTGEGYRPTGAIELDGQPAHVAQDQALSLCLKAGALCNNAQLLEPDRGRTPWRWPDGARRGAAGWRIQGDPTEGALLVAAHKAGFTTRRLEELYEKGAEAPFSSDRRRMSVLARERQTGAVGLYLKGAPDTVLALCTHALDARGQAHPLTAQDRAAILAAADCMAGQALRVLAMAYRPLPPTTPLAADPEPLERDLVFLGLAGMIDPPRAEVRRAVAAATAAGIRTAMITGDHPATALAVAQELGICGPAARVLTGAEIEAMPDEELVQACATVRVFARVSPHHKLRIVRAFKARGEIVAMTGDGVNDAPAVKEADIGVAMGLTGTDVTREAAQLVLADDNYATIVAAVEEGRGIYDNIRKFIRYLLSCNTGEVLTMFGATLLGLPQPLLPLQILWVNLVTDGLPALALGVDPPDPDVMQRPPRRPDEGVFARGLGRKILGRGVLIGAATLALFLWGWLPARDLARAQTLAFAGLVMCQLVHVFDCRSERRSIWEVGWLSNPYLVAAVATSTFMLLAAIYWAPLARVMRTVPLSGSDWVAVLAAAGAGELLVALRRAILYRRVVRAPFSYRSMQGGGDPV